MKHIYSIFIALTAFFPVKAQMVADSTTMQAAYSNQVFYSLNNGVINTVNNENWSIALSVVNTGSIGSSILLNEATSSLWAYPGDTSKWNTFDTTNYNSWKRLLNTDESWANGAFNVYRGAAGQFDMGWGVLNPANNYWTFGDSLYLIKLKNNTFKKLWIISLKTGAWKFKYADINGTNEQVVTFNKSTYPNRNFIYFDMINNILIDREPNNKNWDLTFVKHIDYVAGTYVSVSSVFGNKNVWSAKAFESNNAAALTAATPQTAYTKKINNIGREWKKFSSSTGWAVYDSIAYFVYDNDSINLFRVVFTKFGGSATGTTYFKKQQLNNTGINNNQLNTLFTLSPNPCSKEISIVLSGNKPELVSVEVFSIYGEIVRAYSFKTESGLNQFKIDTQSLSKGVYTILLNTNTQRVAQKFIKDN